MAIAAVCPGYTETDMLAESVARIVRRTGMPAIRARERIAAIVPDARRVEGDLFGSIGAGLAIDAARKFG